MNVGNVRIETTPDGAVRIKRNTPHPEILDCLLTFDEARALGQILLSLDRPSMKSIDFEDLL